MAKLTLSADDIAFAFDLPPEKAIKYFERKGFQTTWDWKEQLKIAHDTAFTVAKAMNADVLQAIRDEVDKSIKTGQTFDEFKKNLEPRLSEMGWWGKKFQVNPATGEKELVTLGTPSKLENIYRTNLASAYNRGRLEQQLENKETRPYGILRVVSDNRTTSYCRSIKDTVFRIDDPEMQRIVPPNHFRCRDRIQTLNESQLERRKLTVTEAKDFFKDDKNKPQEGFDRPPTVAWKPDATKYDKPIAKQLTKALESKPQPKPEAKPKAITETPKPQPTEAQPTQPEVQPKTAKPKTAKPKEAKEYTDVATLSAAAKFAKSLGVQMKFDAKAKLVYKAGSETAKRRLLRATNDTNKAMEMCAALGLPLPPTVLVGPNKFHKIAPGREDDVLGAYNTFDKTFFVNSIAASLDNMAKEMEGMKKLNHLSTSHPLHVPIHELGHAAHHANVMQELAESEVRTFWNDKRNSSVDNGSPLRSWVKREVSIYGQTRLTEFVAETFVKLVTGEHVSDEALALYKECKGAIPTRTKK